jgi:hypothetical protein
MVKLVDAFTEVYGRAPTMKELDDLYALQKDKQRMDRIQKRVEKRAELEAALPNSQQTTRVMSRNVPKTGKIINRMLLRDVSVLDIAFYLDLTENNVRACIATHNLPRKIKNTR